MDNNYIIVIGLAAFFIYFIMTDFLYSQGYDPLDSFESTYRNWAPLGESSIDQNNNGGIAIKYSKRIDNMIMQPLTLPDPYSLAPHVSEGGIDWQINLDPDQIGQFAQNAVDRMQDLFGPDSLDIIASVALQNGLSYIPGDFGRQVEYFMQMIQAADQLTVTYYNHRYEVARDWFKSGQPVNNEENNPFQDTTEFFRNVESDMMGRALSNINAFTPQDPPEIKLINYLQRIALPEAKPGDAVKINEICNALIIAYNITVKEGKDGNSYAAGENNIFNIIYELRKQFDNYELYFVFGNSKTDNLNKVIDKSGAVNFINNPNMNTVILKSGIYQELVNAKSTQSLELRGTYMTAAEKNFIETILRTVDEAVYELNDMDGMQAYYPKEIVDAKKELLVEMRQTSQYFMSEYN